MCFKHWLQYLLSLPSTVVVWCLILQIKLWSGHISNTVSSTTVTHDSVWQGFFLEKIIWCSLMFVFLLIYVYHIDHVARWGQLLWPRFSFGSPWWAQTPFPSASKNAQLRTYESWGCHWKGFRVISTKLFKGVRWSLFWFNLQLCSTFLSKDSWQLGKEW